MSWHRFYFFRFDLNCTPQKRHASHDNQIQLPTRSSKRSAATPSRLSRPRSIPNAPSPTLLQHLKMPISNRRRAIIAPSRSRHTNTRAPTPAKEGNRKRRASQDCRSRRTIRYARTGPQSNGAIFISDTQASRQDVRPTPLLHEPRAQQRNTKSNPERPRPRSAQAA